MIRFRASDPAPFRTYAARFPLFVVEDRGQFIFLEEEKNDKRLRSYINGKFKEMFFEPRRFSIISIETKAGCNFTCTFCPVNRKIDPRPDGELDMSLIRKIAIELAELKYDKTILLFGNNEPLLDERIASIVSIFREHCPHAYIKILTNGVLLTVNRAVELFEAGLSTLSINNYSEKTLIKPVRHLLEAAATFYECDIRITTRDPREVLTTRAGRAPNAVHLREPMRQFCSLPFVDINVTYRGIVTMCCFDAHAETNFGDVSRQSLQTIWSNPAFVAVREVLMRCDRAQNPLCAKCDFDGFRDPYQDPQQPSVRPAPEREKNGDERYR